MAAIVHEDAAVAVAVQADPDERVAVPHNVDQVLWVGRAHSVVDIVTVRRAGDCDDFGAKEAQHGGREL
ncbi:MAG: hypothetical protein AAF628_35865 [Planctomycetota bacterium]